MSVHKTASNPFTPQIRDILKQVDGMLKTEDIEGAQTAIRAAKQADPKNMYVHAYHERINLLLDQKKQNKEAEAALRKSEQDARVKAESERKQRLAEETKRKLEADHARTLAKQDTGKTPESAPVVQHRRVEPKIHAKELEKYNAALFMAWQQGVPEPEQSKNLQALRSSLNISLEEHESLEASARRESYIEALKRLSMSKSLDGPAVLTALHRKFGIHAGEYEQIDFEVLTQAQAPKTRPCLAVIDDDENMLRLIADLLTDRGFEVQTFTTSDDAYRFLLQSTPDLILADINLESSTMGGFAFFEKLQAIPRLATLPFIFVSGLTDDIVVRAGKELGADDYITKPFASDTLVSIIKGKLRRYSELLSTRTN